MNEVEQSGPKFRFEKRVTNCPRKKGIYCKGVWNIFHKARKDFCWAINHDIPQAKSTTGTGSARNRRISHFEKIAKYISQTYFVKYILIARVGTGFLDLFAENHEVLKFVVNSFKQIDVNRHYTIHQWREVGKTFAIY